MFQRFLPPFLILASLTLVAIFPSFPTAIVFLGALVFYALNAKNYETLSTLERSQDSLWGDIGTLMDARNETNSRITALEKTVEVIPSLKEAIIAVKNRGFVK